MERVLDWGIEVVLWFQQASPQLDAVFAAFTFLGDEEFFLIALPLIYWSIDRAVGVRLMVLFPVSRVYLGVHFPTDVLGGYVLGALVLWLWLRYGVRLEQWFFEQETIHQLILIVAVPALAMAVWPTEDMVTGGGTMVGLGAGLVLERRLVGFDVAGTLLQRAVRFLVGIAVLAGLWLGLRALFDGREPAIILRLVRYSLVGFWGVIGAPWMFVKLGLAQREAEFQPKPITWG